MLNVIYLVCKPQVQGQGSQLIITCNDTMNTSNTFIHLLMDFFSQITSQTRWHFEAKQQNVGAVCCLCSEMWLAKYRSWSITCLADDGVLHIYHVNLIIVMWPYLVRKRSHCSLLLLVCTSCAFYDPTAPSWRGSERACYRSSLWGVKQPVEHPERCVRITRVIAHDLFKRVRLIRSYSNWVTNHLLPWIGDEGRWRVA